MRILIIFLAVLLSACGDIAPSASGNTEPCRPIYYSDSIGWQMEQHGLVKNIDFDTKKGRKLIDVVFNPSEIGGDRENWQFTVDYSYCHIYLAVGSNDIFDLASGELALIQILEGHRDKITCVLPMTIWGDEPPMRDVMLRECKFTIDPIVYGIYPLHPDAVHLSETDGGANIAHYSSMFMPGDI